jgi:hypothetical protein
MDTIVNKVAESGILSLDLQDYLPAPAALAEFDLKDYLFMGLILKEKDFRAALQSISWSAYQDKSVALHCSVDTLIPSWAYMLVGAYLQPVARTVFMGNIGALRLRLLLDAINAMPVETYRDQRVVVKGCGDQSIPADAYLAVTLRLRPVVKSIMYGEPCSTVPVFKKK